MNAISSFAPPFAGRILLPLFLTAVGFAAHPAVAQADGGSIDNYNLIVGGGSQSDVISYSVTTTTRSPSEVASEIEEVYLHEKTYDSNGIVLSDTKSKIDFFSGPAPGTAKRIISYTPDRTIPANAQSLGISYEIVATLIVPNGSGTTDYSATADTNGYVVTRTVPPSG